MSRVKKRMFTVMVSFAMIFIVNCAVARGNVPSDSRTGLPIEENRRLEDKASYDQSCKDASSYSYKTSDGTKHTDCVRQPVK